MGTLTVWTFWWIAEKLFRQPGGLCNTGMMSWSVWRQGEWRKISIIAPFYILNSTQIRHDYVTVCRERKEHCSRLRSFRIFLQSGGKDDVTNEKKLTCVLPILFNSAETTGHFLWIWPVREKEFVSKLIQIENNDDVKPKWLNSPQFR